MKSLEEYIVWSFSLHIYDPRITELVEKESTCLADFRSSCSDEVVS